MLLIVEIVPYIAFLGAAVMVGWVGFDILREKRRRSPAPAPQDSGRALAGPPKPMNTEEETAVAPPEELILPNSHAVDVAGDEEECENETPKSESADEDQEEEPSAEPPAETKAEGSDESVIPVRRDPSVRVFDTAVAASERKVASD